MGGDVSAMMEGARYKGNPYAGKDKGKFKRKSNQEPKRMELAAKTSPTGLIFKKTPEAYDTLMAELYKEREAPDMPTDWECRIWMAEPKDKDKVIQQVRAELSRMRKERAEKDPRAGLELVQRHRYGDDIDILRKDFHMSIEQVEEEKFELVQATRMLWIEILEISRHCPKIEKYVMGAIIRETAHQLLELAISVKLRYYRKNMLENMDIKLHVLRELYFNAHVFYSDWVTTDILQRVYVAINKVSMIVGALLKSTVC